MRSRLASWCRRLAAWLEPSVVEESLLLRAARFRVEEVERISVHGASGEYKRHVVYASLLKTHPWARRRDVGLAIEQAVQGLP